MKNELSLHPISYEDDNVAIYGLAHMHAGSYVVTIYDYGQQDLSSMLVVVYPEIDIEDCFYQFRKDYCDVASQSFIEFSGNVCTVQLKYIPYSGHSWIKKFHRSNESSKELCLTDIQRALSLVRQAIAQANGRG